MSGEEKKNLVYEKLKSLGIAFETTEHPAVFTIEEMDSFGIGEKGEICKNLFLRDAKGKRHFLVVVQKDKRVNLGELSKKLESTKLGFASPERLEKFLNLSKGEVTPLGILNDKDAQVEVVFDKTLEGNPRLGVHPNVNTATVWISFDDLLKVVKENKNTVSIIKI